MTAALCAIGLVGLAASRPHGEAMILCAIALVVALGGPVCAIADAVTGGGR